MIADEEEPELEEELEDEEADDDDDEGLGGQARRRIERLLRKTVEKGIEAGVGTINTTNKTLRGVTDVKLPKEAVSFLFSQVDETKNILVRVVAGEVRDFLDATDIATELQRALTALSFEVKMEVRFIPNDSGGIKPQIKPRAKPKRTRRKKKKKGEADEEESAAKEETESKDEAES